MGKQYERRKSRQGGDHGNQHVAKPQNEVLANTANKISTEQKVSRATVERAAEYYLPDP